MEHISVSWITVETRIPSLDPHSHRPHRVLDIKFHSPSVAVHCGPSFNAANRPSASTNSRRYRSLPISSEMSFMLVKHCQLPVTSSLKRPLRKSASLTPPRDIQLRQDLADKLLFCVSAGIPLRDDRDDGVAQHFRASDWCAQIGTSAPLGY